MRGVSKTYSIVECFVITGLELVRRDILYTLASAAWRGRLRTGVVGFNAGRQRSQVWVRKCSHLYQYRPHPRPTHVEPIFRGGVINHYCPIIAETVTFLLLCGRTPEERWFRKETFRRTRITIDRDLNIWRNDLFLSLIKRNCFGFWVMMSHFDVIHYDSSTSSVSQLDQNVINELVWHLPWILVWSLLCNCI